MAVVERLVRAAQRLRDDVDALRFLAPVTHVYDPLAYAWAAHEQYLRAYATTRKQVLLLGMNPGPFGMAQTGVPFGEVATVRDWMKIDAPISRPENEHEKRPILGFASKRSEVSGQRLWGAIRARYPKPRAFFKDHLVVNYCPLLFLEASGRNRTPDKLPADERAPLEAACDAHLDEVIATLQPRWLLGVGAFAQKRLQQAASRLGSDAQVAVVLHPSPASPRANRDWIGAARADLLRQSVPSFL